MREWDHGHRLSGGLSVQQVLELPLMSSADVVTGAAGLDRIVER